MAGAMDVMQTGGDTLFLAIILLSLAFLFHSFSNVRRRNLPPGPKGLPVIGNVLMLRRYTHRGLAQLGKQYGGVVHLRFGALRTVAVTTPAAAREVLQLRDGAFSNRPATVAVRYLTYGRADIAFANYGPYWRQMRKLSVVKLFSRRRVESWAAVRDEVDSLVARASATSSPVNVADLVSSLALNIIYRAAFGSSLGESKVEFTKILRDTSKLMGELNVMDFLPRWLRWVDVQGFNKQLERARASLDRFIDRVIQEHMMEADGEKVEGADDNSDMVDGLLRLVGDGEDGGDQHSGLRLRRDNVKAIIMVHACRRNYHTTN